MANRYTFLSSWLAWWHTRRYHAFTAFKRLDNAPAANLSEIEHAKMKFSSQTNMMLEDTARADIAETLRPSIEIQTFKEGTGRALGQGPNAAERRRRITQAQNKRARDNMHELFDESNLAIQENNEHSNNFILSKSSRHRPPKPKQAKVVEQQNKNASLAHEPVQPNRPPCLVLYQGFNVKKCYGCNSNFVDKYRQLPYDLLLRKSAYRKFYNKTAGTIQWTPKPVFRCFHLSMSCLRREFSHSEKKDIIIHDETKQNITEAHRTYLTTAGFSDLGLL